MTEHEAPPAPPQPTAEHERLTANAGVWDVRCKFFMDPSQPPMEVDGRETIEAFGPFWTVSHFEAEMFGAPFHGRATLGFDPLTGEHVSSWIDSMTPNDYHFRGRYDASGKVLEMSGEGVDCHSGRMASHRFRTEHRGPDEFVTEMFTKMPDGSEVQLFRHVYRRRR